MKHRLDSLNGFTIGGTDGEIGKVKDFYFDDKSWTIRYIIVETGSWLSGRKVLLSPKAVVDTAWDQSVFRVNLTMEQIKNSPTIDTDKPVSRQHETALYNYYPWGGPYWGGGFGMGVGIGTDMPYSKTLDEAIQNENNVTDDDASDDDPHLRSIDKVSTYSIKASDGEIGDVKDFIVNDSNWRIDFMLVDTGNWFPGKKVLIAPTMIKEIVWETAIVVVNATQEIIKDSPEYIPGEELKESYASDLQAYYGRQR
jgi:uncharacterized protein YrrD